MKRLLSVVLSFIVAATSSVVVMAQDNLQNDLKEITLKQEIKALPFGGGIKSVSSEDIATENKEGSEELILESEQLEELGILEDIVQDDLEMTVDDKPLTAYAEKAVTITFDEEGNVIKNGEEETGITPVGKTYGVTINYEFDKDSSVEYNENLISDKLLAADEAGEIKLCQILTVTERLLKQ